MIHQKKKYFLLPLIAFILTMSTGSHSYPQALESDESFDPFSDYNEFEQDTDEEADINFLNHFLDVGSKAIKASISSVVKSNLPPSAGIFPKFISGKLEMAFCLLKIYVGLPSTK